MNYQALGEYHAHKQQAKDAADKRFALLYNLSTQIRNLSECPEKTMDMEALNAALQEAKAAEAEMTAALGRANEAAPLCGETAVTINSFKR